MTLRRTHGRATAAARAGFSERTGRRIEADPRPPSERAAPPRPAPARPARRGLGERDRCRCWSADPGPAAGDAAARICRCRHPDAPRIGVRRTLERRVRALARAAWPGARGDLPPGPSAGAAGRCRTSPTADRARRQHRRRAVRAPALPLRPGLLRLGACRRGARRRELHRPGRGPAERALDARRRAARAPLRQPLRRLPQPRRDAAEDSDPPLRGALRPLRHARRPATIAGVAHENGSIEAPAPPPQERARPGADAARPPRLRRPRRLARASSTPSSAARNAAATPPASRPSGRTSRSCRPRAPPTSRRGRRPRHPHQRLQPAHSVFYSVAVAPDRPAPARAHLRRPARVLPRRHAASLTLPRGRRPGRRAARPRQSTTATSSTACAASRRRCSTSVYRDELFPAHRLRRRLGRAVAALPARAACRRMVGLLASPMTRPARPNSPRRSPQLLDAGELPDLASAARALRAEAARRRPTIAGPAAGHRQLRRPARDPRMTAA